MFLYTKAKCTLQLHVYGVQIIEVYGLYIICDFLFAPEEGSFIIYLLECQELMNVEHESLFCQIELLKDTSYLCSEMIP